MNKIHTEISKALTLGVTETKLGFHFEGMINADFSAAIIYYMRKYRYTHLKVDGILGYTLSFQINLKTGFNSMDFIECNVQEFSEFYYRESIKEGLVALERQLELEATYADVADVPFHMEA